MAQCERLFDPTKDTGLIRIKLLKAIKTGKIEDFTNYLQKYKANEQVRVVLETYDPEDQATLSVSQLWTTINEILDRNVQAYPKELSKDIVLAKTAEALNAIDNSQTQAVDDDIETKTVPEEEVLNTASLKTHLAEVYGPDSFDIVRSLNQKFEDLMASAAYWNRITGLLVNLDNTALNKNIQAAKTELFRDLVTFLKSTFPDDSFVQGLSEDMYLDQKSQESDSSKLLTFFDYNNYSQVMNVFYSRIINDENFKAQLRASHISSIIDTERRAKNENYKAIVRALMDQDENFKQKFFDKFKQSGSKSIRMQNQLYTLDHLSEGFYFLKKFVNDPKNQVPAEIVERVLDLESRKNISLLQAVDAYTMLQYFDSMLKNLYGNQISIDPETVDIQSADINKYSHALDTTHQKKNWQQGEDMGSEAHIAKLAKSIIGMIDVYSYQTGEYMFRRMDTTQLIGAARALLDGIATQRIGFYTGNNVNVEEAIKQLNIAIATFHADPVVKMQEILELLFSRVKRSRLESDTLVSRINKGKEFFTDTHINILYSLYNIVFDKSNPTSFYNQSMNKARSISKGVERLLEEVAGLIDRNVVADYLEVVYDFETGKNTVKLKKKYFNNKQLWKLRTTINEEVNQKSVDGRAQLQETYKFTLRDTANATQQEYAVTIGDSELKIRVPNLEKLGILARYDKNRPMVFDQDTKTLLKDLSDVDLISFRYAILDNVEFEAGSNEQKLKEVLQFLDDTLGMHILSDMGLQTLNTLKSIYTEVDKMNNYLMPLVKLGVRAAYVNSLYCKYNDYMGDPNNQENKVDFYEYLRANGDSIFKQLTENKSKLATKRFNDFKYVVASGSDQILNQWVDAYSILVGEAAKATTRDSQGNYIPNNSIVKMGSNLNYYLVKQFGEGESTPPPTRSLLFVKDRGLIVRTYHDLEVTNMLDESKSVSDFNNNELFYHAIFNKFWAQYLANGNIIVQPTTYSDKKTFLNWEIKGTINDPKSGKAVDLIKASTNDIMDLYSQTIGNTVKAVYESTVSKLQTIATEYARKNNISTDQDYRDILHLMSEQDLVKTAQELKLTVELNKDYKVIQNKERKSVVGVNELLRYNAALFDPEDPSHYKLARKLKKEEVIFLNQLLINGCSYQVLTGNDTLDMYTSDEIYTKATSKNPILNTIKEYFDVEGRKDFMSNWVDAETGKLILAKQGDTDIISSADNFDENSDIQLNPLFEKFFYVEGLCSNNLRYSLTGSEVNHAPQKNSPLTRALKSCRTDDNVKNLIQWNTITKSDISVEDFALIHNDENTGILDNVLDADDLQRSLQDLGILEGNAPDTISEDVMSSLSNLLNSTYDYNTNTSQGTQFKRNVIIPATLQYCMQNTKEGIPPQTKCAVIRDTQAAVFNYRGSHEGTIDSCDGSALITPFQCIMENRSLGSQAVGFTKKPIWHHYDINSSTAFLAKFATTTMTNESMRATLNSISSHFNLFKKATNLQWDSAENIDLTKTLTATVAFADNPDLSEADAKSKHAAWFNTVILGEKNLYYEDSTGEIVQIVNFGRSKTENGTMVYYTDEETGAMDPVRKYHIFYDENTNGRITKSVHTTVSTIQQAERTIRSLKSLKKNPHTINSLFELHTALGGIYCVDENGNISEQNNEVVVNFMNNIGSKKDNSKEYVNQANYNQPLKKYQIGYLLNNTAVKNGAKNINPETSWSDDTDFTYFEVDTDGLGMQQNADHDVIDSELTEFSQVIAATAAYGYTFKECSLIYQGLARSAFQSSKTLLDATRKFLAAIEIDNYQQAISDLYDAVGRIISVNRQIKDTENLTNIIMSAVDKIFSKYSDHTNDEAKIPFSDANIYETFISTLASTINASSIKRKHPGSGNVLVAAYNMIQYFEVTDDAGNIVKLMADDVLTRARTAYKNELIEYLKAQGEYDEEKDQVKIGRNTVRLSSVSLATLIEAAVKADDSGSFSQYYLDSEDVTAINKHLIETYLKNQQRDMPVFADRSYFMPSDIVEVLDSNGNVIETVDLNSLKAYYNFKNGLDQSENAYPEGCQYRISATRPHNLRPSLIRWQYLDADGNQRYMNYFDLSFVKNAWNEVPGFDPNSPTYRAIVQKALNDISNGRFTDDEGNEIAIIEGSLENEAAELVMSNLYKETFGIKNESLADILSQGEDYFLQQNDKLKAPVNDVYDIAFLKDNGRHVLITTGNVKNNELVCEKPFSTNETSINDEDEIYLTKKGRQIFKIGKWADVTDVTIETDKNGITKYLDASGKNLDTSLYRLKDGKVQKKYEYVKRYNLTIKGRNGNYTRTLYKIADVATIKEALSGDTVSVTDAMRQQQTIIKNIYRADDYKLVEINPIKATHFSAAKRSSVVNSLNSILHDPYVSSEVKKVLETQIKTLGSTDIKTQIAAFKEAKEAFLREEAHKKWVSFQDSLKIISSRIPAQSLQSFMAMKTVGWTKNTTNMAYVSHFQTYLQGSDYDIDKAYIMGQSYDSNAKYINWSPYFDYGSLQTLEASKSLTVPKGVEVEFSEDSGVDISNEINTLLMNSSIATDSDDKERLSINDKSNEEKVAFLKALSNALYKIERSPSDVNDDKCVFTAKGLPVKNKQRIISALEETFNKHESFIIPVNTAEAAYKNIASANIYAVSHDIRNRDQAYTAISMGLIRSAAEHSPKGEQVTTLNMLNPLTKYVMQDQNLVGKKVVGIAANGEKYWFNLYYYWNQVLLYGSDDDLKYLKFSTTLSRIKGRAKGTEFDPENNTVTYIPDLDVKNDVLGRRLREAFISEGEEEDSLDKIEYKYVDQTISQLLSAATDNAKELILAKINANTDFAKMLIYLTITGYDINDIAAFMTTPAGEYICNKSSINIFQRGEMNIYPLTAINLASGEVRCSVFLHGNTTVYDPDIEEFTTVDKKQLVKADLLSVLNTVGNEGLLRAVRSHLDINPESDISTANLDSIMQAFILTAVDQPRILGNEDLNIYTLIGRSSDIEINNYLQYCQELIIQLRGVVKQYHTFLGKKGIHDLSQSLEYMLADVAEFKKVYNLSSEMSTITVGLLGLNQGIPTDKLGLIKKLNSIRRIVTDRESIFNIDYKTLFAPATTAKAQSKQNETWAKVVSGILEANPYLSEIEVRNGLMRAYAQGLMNEFDPIKLLVNETITYKDPETEADTNIKYRDAVKEYLHIIKGMINAVDMIYKIPHYAQIMDCLRAHVIADRSLSIKSRLINELNTDNNNLSDKQLQGIINYIDKLMAFSFLRDEDITVVTHKAVQGFSTLFDNTVVSSFDLGTLEGSAGFKRFVETDFLEYLRENYGDNPLVDHLAKVVSGDVVNLATDIDLMNPGVTASTSVAYNEILNGMSDFEQIQYGNSGYTIADIFQLYNLIVNTNKYGSERLTSTFKGCQRKDSILQQYLKYISENDQKFNTVFDHNRLDYLINAAPIVSPRAERFHREEYIKVQDPVWGYTIKKFNSKTGTYNDDMITLPFIGKNEPINVINSRRTNFMQNSVFEMPYFAGVTIINRALAVDGEMSEDAKRTLETIIFDNSVANKILITKLC